MASRKSKPTTAVPSKSQFAESILSLSHRFPLFQVFDDFLTMSMASCTQNPDTGKSWYEEEYLNTIATYKESELRHEFPKAFAGLIQEMEARVHASEGNDVLGEFFEQHISHGNNGQFFTPAPICQFMAAITHDESDVSRPLRILDPACGSGRMLIASSKLHGPGHEYYGIDIDRTCAKMTALNLFLNGVFESEVLCANALLPGDFVIAYRVSFLPLGIFKIESKEDSRLWHLHSQSFTAYDKNIKGSEIILDPTPFSERKPDNSIQLDLF